MYSWIARWIFLLWDALLVFWAVMAMTSAPGVQRRGSESRFLQVAIQVVGLWMLFGSSHLLRKTILADRLLPPDTEVAVSGLALTIVGMLFSAWARIADWRNGSNAVTSRQGHPLIHKGPYNLVRYPIYSGIIFAALGTAIVFLRAECFVGAALIATGFWLRMRMEDEFMLQQFGEEYARYRSSVRALIPFVY